MTNLDNIFRFSELLNKFRRVTRVILVNGEERYENDVEHSYMLAILADYIISTEKLSFDRHKVMMYCLLHDLVEVYAGDTYFYSTDLAHVDSKQKREEDALKQLIVEFPEYFAIKDYITTYESKVDEESKFVYALDKIQPVIQIYLDSGRTWKTHGVLLSHLVEKKSDKVKVSPEAEKYWKEFVLLLENHRELFPNE